MANNNSVTHVCPAPRNSEEFHGQLLPGLISWDGREHWKLDHIFVIFALLTCFFQAESISGGEQALPSTPESNLRSPQVCTFPSSNQLCSHLPASCFSLTLNFQVSHKLLFFSCAHTLLLPHPTSQLRREEGHLSSTSQRGVLLKRH